MKLDIHAEETRLSQRRSVLKCWQSLRGLLEGGSSVRRDIGTLIHWHNANLGTGVVTATLGPNSHCSIVVTIFSNKLHNIPWNMHSWVWLAFLSGYSGFLLQF